MLATCGTSLAVPVTSTSRPRTHATAVLVLVLVLVLAMLRLQPPVCVLLLVHVHHRQLQHGATRGHVADHGDVVQEHVAIPTRLHSTTCPGAVVADPAVDEASDRVV